MNRIVIRLSALVIASLLVTTAQAYEKITDVTNDRNATNGCEVAAVAGYRGANFHTTIYELDCPGEPAINPEKTITHHSWNYRTCEMVTHTPGYHTGGDCGDYSIYKED